MKRNDKGGESMMLNELTVRFQALCHDGYSLSEVKARIGDIVVNLSEITFLLESELLKNPIEVKVGEEK